MRAMWMAALAVAVAVAGGAAAEAPLDAAAFDRYTRGRVLAYGIGGEVYGRERYLPGRRVVWAFAGDECRDGKWYEDAEAQAICFVYEGDPMHHCWRFFVTGAGLRAEFLGDPAGTPLVEVSGAGGGLHCGPEAGV